MSTAWSVIVFALGFFALVAQTLLFRSFLTAFEGNELGVGSFFGSWLVWVALGALLGRLAVRLEVIRRSGFALAVLLYVPAFVGQHFLVTHARELAGVASYEVFPLQTMVAHSFLVNAPISLVTGFLFTLACRFAASKTALPVARVYILEGLGGFAGGIAVTALLASGVREETVFLRASLVLALAVALFQLSQREFSPLRRFLGLAPPVVILAILAGNLDTQWTTANNRAAWQRLLPVEAYQGSFATAQGKYLFGEREGQFLVMSWGGVSETLPDTEHASEVVALTVCQNPAARRVMVVGPSSLAICRRFAALPQVESVAWLDPDPEYPEALESVLPERFRSPGAELEIPAVDVRTFVRGLGSRSPRYDIVVLNLPDVTTLVLNRYSTVEFFRLLGRALSPDGVVALRVSGGANYVGSELIYLGSSALETLSTAFSQVVLKPGDESWLIASDGATLSTSPAVLRDKLAQVEGIEQIYPPEGLLSLYLPDRVDFQLGEYAKAAGEARPGVLLNRDERPKALLYSLAVALRRATGRTVAPTIEVALTAGAWVCAAAILLFALLRFVYLRTSLPTPPKTPRSRTPFDGAVLVFSTGLVGMSLSVVLMFLYQSRHGSLFLHVGLVSSLFMLGLSVGSWLGERVLRHRRGEPGWLLPALVAAYAGVLLVVYLLPETAPPYEYALLFAVSGVVTGGCFPIGALRLQLAGTSRAAAGANLETVDHLGGAVGAVLAGLVLLPLLGTSVTVALLALLVLVNLTPCLVPRRGGVDAAWDQPGPMNARGAGLTLLGAAAFLLVASNIVQAVRTDQESRRLEEAARELTDGAELERRQARLADGNELLYFAVAGPRGETEDPNDPGEPLPKAAGGYVFSTGPLAAEFSGYGGPIALAVHVEPTGRLEGWRVLRSRETPAYLARLENWRETLAGKNVFTAGAFQDVDAVSGATMTSRAVLEILEYSGPAFAVQVLGMEADHPVAPRRSPLPDLNFLCLTFLTASAIALRRVPRVWIRRLFLALSLVAAGLWLNLQYSTQQVLSLLGLELPTPSLTGGFFLAVVMPVLVLFFGNIYCGYICPLGALQELVGDLRPTKRMPDPPKSVWRYGRTVKYVILALLVALFALSRDFTVLASDPLVTFFAGEGGFVFWFGAAAVVLSLVFRRFWCRNLCPAGAFLALLSRVRLLRKFLPLTYPGRCDLGVRTPLELDCLSCDRCRYEEN